MKITELELKNFRNYDSVKLELDSKLNFFVGKNASGKTNLLESIYCLGVGKSFKTTKDKEVIKWGEDSAYLSVKLDKKYRSHTIEMLIDNKGAKRILINKIPVLKISELIGFLKVVLFSPEEMKFIKETPLERRRFMDISLSQQDKSYYYNLVNYNKALKQRNKILKDYYMKPEVEDLLPLWDDEMIKKAVIVAEKRREFLVNLEAIAKEKMLQLTDGKENIKLEYESRVDLDSDDIFKSYKKTLAEDLEKDKKLMYTNSGVHRDDIKIEVNGIDIRKYGSQGQQRSAALALKLAEVDLFYQKTGEKPILLLDDVLSELDLKRQHQLINIASAEQTIITATHYDLENELKKTIFTVDTGKIVDKEVKQ